MKKLLLLALTTCAFAELSDTVHSSISTYVESKSFTNSKQKDDGITYGVGVDVHYKHSAYKITYEHTDTNTKQPPLPYDLKIDKLFLKYGYEFNDTFGVNLNYISILNDNLAITDGGKIYGLGFSYNHLEHLSSNFTQYLSEYDDFNIYQSDLRIDYDTHLGKVHMKISSITKYIIVDEENPNGFTKNAEDDYLTTGIKLHAHYKTYHFGAGAYFGKRVFAIMDDGFKVQHHAMEINKTYALGVGKVFLPFIVRFQYVFQEATELSIQNPGVKVDMFRLVGNYKF